jgi:hypothetical protein
MRLHGVAYSDGCCRHGMHGGGCNSGGHDSALSCRSHSRHPKEKQSEKN